MYVRGHALRVVVAEQLSLVVFVSFRFSDAQDPAPLSLGAILFFVFVYIFTTTLVAITSYNPVVGLTWPLSLCDCIC